MTLNKQTEAIFLEALNKQAEAKFSGAFPGEPCRNILGEPWPEHPGGTEAAPRYKGNCYVGPRGRVLRGNRPGRVPLPGSCVSHQSRVIVFFVHCVSHQPHPHENRRRHFTMVVFWRGWGKLVGAYRVPSVLATAPPHSCRQVDMAIFLATGVVPTMKLSKLRIYKKGDYKKMLKVFRTTRHRTLFTIT